VTGPGVTGQGLSGPGVPGADQANAVSGVAAVDQDDPGFHGTDLSAADLGSLNAAHAADPALANAADPSVVGQIADYEAEVTSLDGEAEDAAAALNAAARNRSLDQATVEAVNSLLGLDPAETTVSAEDVAAAAENDGTVSVDADPDDPNDPDDADLNEADLDDDA
jgi:hypothetical protein